MTTATDIGWQEECKPKQLAEHRSRFNRVCKNLLSLFFADKERVFTKNNVGCTLQLVAPICCYVELDNVINHQTVISDLVTVAKWNLDRPVQQQSINLSINVVFLRLWSTRHPGALYDDKL